jgi:predicted N-acyltransferase
VQFRSNDYVIRVLASPAEVDASDWNGLVAAQEGMDGAHAPFMRHEYLAALQESASAVPRTGWTPQFITLWRNDQLHAACALYLKAHSYGEYVFDWAWANAYEQHGLRYYPKALVAVPFTPVPGPRLLAIDPAARQALIAGLVQWCQSRKLSSLHLLFAAEADVAACEQAGLMLRHTVQFHWHNAGYASFDAFLAALSQEKRKKIRQERRKVAEAGVSFRWAQGRDITPQDWAFFYQCYERTYLEHGNAPYLSRAFFDAMARDLPDHWLLFIASREGRPIASSLIALDAALARAGGQFDPETPPCAAYGRYWGALERVDCLHFEACYYQPIQWCIEQGVQRFEGGAQGEHKMARALMPVRTTSAHWLAHPAFADAVQRFLEQEGEGISRYVEHLGERSPFRRPDAAD